MIKRAQLHGYWGFEPPQPLPVHSFMAIEVSNNHNHFPDDARQRPPWSDYLISDDDDVLMMMFITIFAGDLSSKGRQRIWAFVRRSGRAFLGGICPPPDDYDDVYYYIRCSWRPKLEGETENVGVCTKERKGVTAEVLMATPCTNSLLGFRV